MKSKVQPDANYWTVNRETWDKIVLFLVSRKTIYVLHISQGHLTFSYYLIFDRIVCVLVTFYQWGHFVMLIIRNLNLITVQSWTYLGPWAGLCLSTQSWNSSCQKTAKLKPVLRCKTQTLKHSSSRPLMNAICSMKCWAMHNFQWMSNFHSRHRASCCITLDLMVWKAYETLNL